MSQTVSVEALLAAAEKPLLLDVRSTLGGVDGRAAYDAGHLPGAVYVDLDDDLADPPGQGGRHPLPAPSRFVAAMQRVGVSPGVQVVAYDHGPGSFAARLWWLLRHYGFDDVRLLDGGLAEWVRLGGEVSTESVDPARGTWTGEPGSMPVVEADEVASLPQRGLLLDVRTAERFRGESEPIDPVAGHIPGAVNAPLEGNSDDHGRLLDPEAIRNRFAALGDLEGPVGVYCGSGVTATHTVLALETAGIRAALHPGSWSGWITDPDRPVATGG